MPLYLVQGHPAAARCADLGERLARIHRGRPGALLDLRADTAVPRLEALIEAQDGIDARAVLALGSLASYGVHELPSGPGSGPGAHVLPGPPARAANTVSMQGGKNGEESTMEDELILARAHARGVAERLAYAGALTPEEAWLLLKLRSDACLVDVRSEAERELVGAIPGAREVEFMRYPDWEENPDFVAQVRREVATQALVLLICRSGQRSHRAAELLRQAGYRQVYNVLEGFEGAKDAQGRRTLNGWRQRGLPWQQ
ncbi:MAG: rhodanese-like domain-containing protein [Pseudomonadota bacterium]